MKASGALKKLFEDPAIRRKIQSKLPYLFSLAEAESSKGGRAGMEVGALREQILIALLIYVFGEKNVNVDIPPTEPEVDVKVCGIPLSIKTFKGKFPVIKIRWASDWEKVEDFFQNYRPTCNLLLAQIRWGEEGGLFLIPQEVQAEVFERLGKDQYLHLPRRGTNARGAGISSTALRELLAHKDTLRIPIKWKRYSIERLAPYKRWLDYWRED